MAKKIILYYHSINSDSYPAIEGSFPIEMEEFISHIEIIQSKRWDIGNPQDLFKPVKKNTVYITGDDGTIDWAINVLPYCERKKIYTYTAVVVGPWLEIPVYPLAHRIQVLLYLDENFILPKLSKEQIDYINKMYYYEKEPKRRFLKGILNLIYNYDAALRFIGEPRKAEAALLRKRFASPSYYKNFKYAIIGNHTITHRAYDGKLLSYIQEICNAQEIIEKKIGRDNTSKIFCLPVKPLVGNIAENLINDLKIAKFEGMFHGSGEWKEPEYIIPRIDAKNVKEYLEKYSD